MTHPPDTAVVCRGVSKTFGSGDAAIHALNGVDLEIHSGELTLLVGPSGCGKTTLISILAGLLDPTEGTVSLFQTEQGELSASERLAFRRHNIGFVFQQYNLLPALTASENAAVPLIIAGQPRQKALVESRAVLTDLGMSHRLHALPSQLSVGQQQRVAIARAIIHQPRLLVCDEPTSALDAQTGQATMELVKNSALHADRAVIVVTHDNRITHFGDRIITMNDGTIESVQSTRQPHRLRLVA